MLGRRDLHDDQLNGIEHLQENERAALWAPLGGGKTVITLTALSNLSSVEDVWPALVISTIRVASSVWPKEPSKWAHLQHLKVSAVVGDAKQRAKALSAKAHIYTINRDNLKWLRKTLGDKWPFKTVIVDEPTWLGGFRLRQGSALAGAMRDVAHTSIDRFIELTGTPAAKGYGKLWGQMWFLDQGFRLGRTYTAFESRWFEKGWDGYSTVPKDHAGREIMALLKDLCLTLEGQEVDEPIWSPVYVDLPPGARKLYRDMEKKLFVEIEGHEIEAFNAAVKTSKVQQIANGACIVDDDENWAEVHRAKLEALADIIAETNGAPLLVAYWFKSDLARLQKAFPQGRVFDANPKTVDEWNEGKISLMFIHPQSGGHGLNLQYGGNMMVLFSLFWSLEFYLQVIERIGPLRQKQSGFDRPVYLWPIIARDTVDEAIVDRWHTHRSVQDILLDFMRRRRA